MKKFLMTLVLLVGIVFGLFAQKLTYQAVIRDNNQQLVVNTAVKATVTIDFAGDQADYTTTITDVSTNLHGLLSIEFGDESLVGRDWTGATIAVKVVNAATSSIVYVNDEPRPVSAVPYALSVDGVAIQQYLTEHKYVTEMQVGNQIHDSISNVAKSHTHSNKALLDTYTQTEANLADAVGKKHSHENMAILNATMAPYTDADSTKLDGIESGAQKNVQSDWKQTDNAKDDYIKNKPSITDTVNNILTTGKYVTETTLDGRHYLTSDSAVIIAMQGNIATNKADITTNTADIAALAGRMNTFNTNVCDSVKNCDFSGNTSIQNMLQQLTVRLDAQDIKIDAQNAKIDSLAHLVDSLAKLVHGGDTVKFTCGTDKVTDYDNNTYNTVKIGKQCWMKENLRTTHYADGTSISLSSSPSTSVITAYCYYPDGNSSNVSTYGYLYNWPAVMGNSTSSSGNPSGVQGICPTGWHVPSDAEWTQLTNYVNSVDDYKCGGNDEAIANALSFPMGWQEPSECGAGYICTTINKTGFSAVPAGNCFPETIDFFGFNAYFWSATQYVGLNALYRQLSCDNSDVRGSYFYMGYGFSVRCLKDEGGSSATLPTVTTTSVTNITHNSATSGGDVTADGGANVTARGVCWSTNQNPTIADSHTADGSGTGSFSSSITGLSPNTTYYVRAYATNSVGTSYGTQGSFTTQPFTCGTSTVTDYDNNTYNTVKIGNQCWMKENLRTKLGTDGDKGYPTGAGADSLLYGRLYTWSAMMNSKASSDAVPSGVQGICPTGWHVPSDTEWTQLTTYVNSVADYKCNKVDNNIANALSSPTGWQEPSECGAGHNSTTRNLTGFSAVPAGRYFDGSFHYFGGYASFWSATQRDDRFAWCRNLYSNVSGVSRLSDGKDSGFSVRCLKDN
ncbi:MAG: fibrobacter succinogenes major paralogous domain-containing protein [Bacteroidales bacterium]|nr:fibrobacter succinogenes major paralogous domain-containing protein [Bacteroidales bacterium]